MVIGNAYIGSYKPNYHTITTTPTPKKNITFHRSFNIQCTLHAIINRAIRYYCTSICITQYAFLLALLITWPVVIFDSMICDGVSIDHVIDTIQ